MASSTATRPKFIDIGVNLTDPVFRGRTRNGKHPDDFDAMLRRASAAGVANMIITGGSLRESQEAIKLAKNHGMFATCGCHPTRSAEFGKAHGGPEAYLKSIDRVISQNKTGKGRVVAVGECGLDYDRLHFADEETQRAGFRLQLGLAKKHHLPLFLHSRAAHRDFVQILREEGFGEDGGRAVGGRGGVVHSFTGAAEEVVELTEMGFHFSLNGCGLKTHENLVVAATIPLDKLLLETDAPWCSMTAAHSSNKHIKTLPRDLSDIYFPPSSRNFTEGKMVKGRNEPNAIGGVAWTVSRLKGVEMSEVAEWAWKNTVEVFGIEEGEVEMDVPEEENNPGSSARPSQPASQRQVVPTMDDFPPL